MINENAKQYNARVEKWREMTQNNFGTDPKQLKKRLRKGIPECLRIIIWPKLVRLDQYKKRSQFTYQSLLKMRSPCEREIGLDIGRTLTEEKPDMLRKSLRNVLHALSLAHPTIGYCQGMNTLVMRMLQTLDDETSFWMVSYIISLFPLLQINLKNPRSTELQNYILERLVEQHLPNVNNVIKRQEILYMTFAPRWFITLLSATLPRQTLFRVYDCMFNEGYKVIYRAALTLIKVKEWQILQNNYETNQRYLSGFSEVYDKIPPNDFIDMMFGFSFSRVHMATWERQFLVKNEGFLTKLEKQNAQVEMRRKEDILNREREKQKEIQKEQLLNGSQPKINGNIINSVNDYRPPIYGSQSNGNMNIKNDAYQQQIPSLNPDSYNLSSVQISTQSKYPPSNPNIPVSRNPPPQLVHKMNYIQQPRVQLHQKRYPQQSEPINYMNIHKVFKPIVRQDSEQQIIEDFGTDFIQPVQNNHGPFPRYNNSQSSMPH